LTSDSNAELKFATGPVSHVVLFGADYRRFKERSAIGGDYIATPFDLYAPVYTSLPAPTMFASPDALQQQAGVYAQNQMRLARGIAVVGVGPDRVQEEGVGSPTQVDQATSSRYGLMYELPFGLTPYVSYSKSFNPVFGVNTCVTLFCKPVTGEQ